MGITEVWLISSILGSFGALWFAATAISDEQESGRTHRRAAQIQSRGDIFMGVCFLVKFAIYITVGWMVLAHSPLIRTWFAPLMLIANFLLGAAMFGAWFARHSLIKRGGNNA